MSLKNIYLRKLKIKIGLSKTFILLDCLKFVAILVYVGIGIIISIAVAVYFILKRKNKHWQQGYIMINNFKPQKESKNSDYPLYNPPQKEEETSNDIIMPPGMFD